MNPDYHVVHHHLENAANPIIKLLNCDQSSPGIKCVQGWHAAVYTTIYINESRVINLLQLGQRDDLESGVTSLHTYDELTSPDHWIHSLDSTDISDVHSDLI